MSSNNDKCLIVGIGQVGKVIFEALKKEYELFEHDIELVKKRRGKNYQMVEVQTPPEKCQNAYMHICIPFSENFISIVKQYHKAYDPKLILIHSCVSPGTTFELFKVGLPIVHSPTIFDDNNFSSLQSFRKIIGYDKPELALMAESHMRKCFNTALVDKSVSTELADLLFNLYFMACRAITFEMSTIFSNIGLDYKVLMELIHYNNTGYLSLNKYYMQLHNMLPDLNKEDFRTRLLDLLPKELQSLFFKLSMKSYGLELEERNKNKETKNAEPKKVHEQG